MQEVYLGINFTVLFCTHHKLLSNYLLLWFGSPKHEIRSPSMSEKQERYEISEKTHQEFVDQSHVSGIRRARYRSVWYGIVPGFLFGIPKESTESTCCCLRLRGKGWLESGGMPLHPRAGLLHYGPVPASRMVLVLKKKHGR